MDCGCGYPNPPRSAYYSRGTPPGDYYDPPRGYYHDVPTDHYCDDDYDLPPPPRDYYYAAPRAEEMCQDSVLPTGSYYAEAAPSRDCGCEGPAAQAKHDDCAPPPKHEAQAPMNICPAICLPGWFQCPPVITVPPYPAPAGVTILPISAGRKNRQARGEPSPAPRISGSCPMATRENHVCNTSIAKSYTAAASGFFNKILSYLGFGAKKSGETKHVSGGGD